jgi:3,4-dihydroxy 2-butanone 4-phosphate synthase/GTP cyclohydrolase II
LPLISVADVVGYRLRHDAPVSGSPIRRCAEAKLPTPYGTWRAIGYAGSLPGSEHLALVMGDPRAEAAPIVALHASCVAGDTLASVLCDCGARLKAAMLQIARAGCGAIVYVRVPATSDALLSAFGRHEINPTTERDAAAIVADLGLPHVALVNPDDGVVAALARAGVTVAPGRPDVHLAFGAALRAA